jgi:hypothetical protein
VAPTPPAVPAGVSAFVAKVLDQLSLSAWLPAALLTASLTLLLQFRAQLSADVTQALAAITSEPLRLLILTLPVLIIGTLVTQAFSFEAIRVLEGYWRRRGLPSLASNLLIRWHVSRKQRLERRRLKAAREAFATVRPILLQSGLSHAVVNGLESQALEIDLPRLSEDEKEVVDQMGWRSFCQAWDLARIDQLALQEKDYPSSSRVLPTKLGNVIRATEDSLSQSGQDLEGFALRRRTAVSARTQLQHDQFRTRLDMYCTLVFVSGLLVVVTPLLLMGRLENLQVVGITVGFLALAITSYNAAIASARGYCVALKQMDQVPELTTSTPAS